MKLNWVTIVLWMISCVAAAADAPSARKPVLVELFTSEGCSSCPPAEGMLSAYTKSQPFDGVEIIPLAWHVDYFNDPWVDPYSSKQYTARQREYVDRFGLRSCYTPQVVVDGTAEFVGGEKPTFAEAMSNARKAPKGAIEVTIQNGGDEKSAGAKIAVSNLPAITPNDAAEVFTVVTENGLINAVKRGENGGSKLRHAAVVRWTRKVGQIDPKAPTTFVAQATIALDPAWKRDQLQVVTFVQELRSGRILAVASSPLPAAATK
jgi:hypothetical protein